MREQDFEHEHTNMQKALEALGYFGALGYKFVCITANRDGSTSVVFMPHIDSAQNDTIHFYYAVDLNKHTISEKLAEAIAQGSDFTKEIPGINCIPKETLDNTRKF